ncbi:uncharacterized protein LOC120182583 [Hibiscus syriacus]|uniref:uncharacterized protein LOC120182583 n=1 Tax=Hibiscus syriacus TaxID=106335 RepID=UPI0019207CD2|nr:uncharacterized protein LOC120182583 [Hibiscus syriacus]
MCFELLCGKQERELGRMQAPGFCPHCGGKVEAVDVESKWRLCFLLVCFKIKRKYYCIQCAKRLVLYF